MNKTNLILKQVLERIKPSKDDLKFIDDVLADFLGKLKMELKKQKIIAEIFVGGSFAKNTVIKKDFYDVDVFVRFAEDKNISEQTEKILKRFENIL